MSKPLIICWFSCGTASALATKITLDQYRSTHDIRILRIIVEEEHRDNDRFMRDCMAWFDHKIEINASQSAEAVWKRKRYMAGVNGAPCTSEIKIRMRKHFVEYIKPEIQVFGYTSEETRRFERFESHNDGPPAKAPLLEMGITKQMCHVAVADAGIRLPEMYRLGFENNNCIGCVKANGTNYWARVMKYFPDVFEARCKLSREIGCRLLKVDGKRRFLDELQAEGGAE